MRRSLLGTYRAVSWIVGVRPRAAAVRVPRPLASLRVVLDVELDGRRPGGGGRAGQVAQRIAHRPGDGQRLQEGLVRDRRPAGQLLDDDAPARVVLREVGVDAP